MKEISQEIFFRDKIEYGSISIIGLGNDTSSHLKKFDLINSDKVVIYESNEDIDYKFLKQFCDTSDVVWVVGDLQDMFVSTNVWSIVSFLKLIDKNTIAVIKNTHVSIELMKKVKEHVSFLDLDKQENNDMLWTLKSLHRIIYYYNENYNFKDANFPVETFWKNVFKINSEYFLYQADNVLKLLKKLEMNSFLSEQLELTQHCLLSGSNIYSDEVSGLIYRIEEDLDEDTVFYLKDEKSNLKFDDLLLFLSI